MQAHRSSRGMTLIEIAIAMLIVGLMALAVVPSLRTLTGADLRATTGQLAGAIRYMYGRAALTGQTCRMVFQLPAGSEELADEGERAGGAWWAECTEAHVRIGREAKDEEEEEEKADDDLSEEEKAQREILKKASFSAFSNNEVPRVEMGGLFFDNVWVAHLREAQHEGKAYLYFFPMGYTEDAIVGLSDGDDVYSVTVKGLSGRVKVAKGRLEPPRS